MAKQSCFLEISLKDCYNFYKKTSTLSERMTKRWKMRFWRWMGWKDKYGRKKTFLSSKILFHLGLLYYARLHISQWTLHCDILKCNTVQPTVLEDQVCLWVQFHGFHFRSRPGWRMHRCKALTWNVTLHKSCLRFISCYVWHAQEKKITISAGKVMLKSCYV